MAQTGFFWDEKCFWHSGGSYALTAPVGGLVQPLAAGGLPEAPETKRRLKNLIDVTGLARELACQSAPPVSQADLLRVHPDTYLGPFKKLSDAGGGELGTRAPFGPGSYEIAALSAGLTLAAMRAVLSGTLKNAYALSRPPGHHALPDRPNGFCLINNIAVAIEAIRQDGIASRIAVIDWDVHHGNGTEAIFYEDGDVLTISLHQDKNYPLDSGGSDVRGAAAGHGANLNIPLPPGAGHDAYLYAMDQLVRPAIDHFRPEIIVVACGFDASGVDPLSRQLCTSETFRDMTLATMAMADAHAGGRLVLVHEGGYSEAHVPFCGHAVLEALSGTEIRAEDPFLARINGQQPDAEAIGYLRGRIDRQVTEAAAAGQFGPAPGAG